MSGGLQNISLTAFVCAFKALRRNSILYFHDKAYKIAKAIKMSTATFTKYLALLAQKGLIVEDKKGNRTIAPLSKCFPVLFSEYYEKPGKSVFNYVRFFAGFKKVPDFKKYYERIKYALAQNNFNQQQWQIDRKAVINRIKRNRTKVGDAGRLKALMKEAGANCIKELQRILFKVDYIFTSKSHLAKILLCSTATAGALLSKWEQQGKYTRTILCHFVRMPVCKAAFDYLSSLYMGVPVANKSCTGYWLNMGSSIAIPTM